MNNNNVVSPRGFYYSLEVSPYILTYKKNVRRLAFASESRRRAFKVKCKAGKHRIDKGIEMLGLDKELTQELYDKAILNLIDALYEEELKWHAEKVKLQLSKIDQRATEGKTSSRINTELKSTNMESDLQKENKKN